jgi:hypothetical protein
MREYRKTVRALVARVFPEAELEINSSLLWRPEVDFMLKLKRGEVEFVSAYVYDANNLPPVEFVAEQLASGMTLALLRGINV